MHVGNIFSENFYTFLPLTYYFLSVWTNYKLEHVDFSRNQLNEIHFFACVICSHHDCVFDIFHKNTLTNRSVSRKKGKSITSCDSILIEQKF